MMMFCNLPVHSWSTTCSANVFFKGLPCDFSINFVDRSAEMKPHQPRQVTNYILERHGLPVCSSTVQVRFDSLPLGGQFRFVFSNLITNTPPRNVPALCWLAGWLGVGYSVVCRRIRHTVHSVPTVRADQSRSYF